MFQLTGTEKAILGSEISGISSFLVQIQQSGQMTLKEFFLSLGVALLTHLTIYSATNTPKPPQVPPVVPPSYSQPGV